MSLSIRWAEGKIERLPDLATELVRLKVDVIVTSGPTPTRAAKEATVTIPIVMDGIMAPPLAMGLSPAWRGLAETLRDSQPLPRR